MARSITPEQLKGDLANTANLLEALAAALPGQADATLADVVAFLRQASVSPLTLELLHRAITGAK